MAEDVVEHLKNLISLRKELSNLQDMLKHLKDIRESLPREQYETTKKRYEEKIAPLNNQITELENKLMNTLKEQEGAEKQIDAEIDKLKGNLSGLKQMLKARALDKAEYNAQSSSLQKELKQKQAERVKCAKILTILTPEMSG